MLSVVVSVKFGAKEAEFRKKYAKSTFRKPKRTEPEAKTTLWFSNCCLFWKCRANNRNRTPSRIIETGMIRFSYLLP